MSKQLKNTVSRNNSFDELFLVLVEETAAYDYLAEIIADKQKAIVNNDLEKIETLTCTEQLIVNKANALTVTRYEMLLRIFNTNKITDTAVTLSNLFIFFGKEINSSWIEIERRLTGVIKKIQRVNAENQKLLKASIHYVREMIELFYPVDNNDSKMYTSNGHEEKKTKTRNLLDCNI